MPKPVSLSVHKNQRRRRRAKVIRDDIRANVREAQREFGTGLCGYALVMWDEDNGAIARWSGVGVLKNCPVEEFAKSIIVRTKGQMDAEEIVFGPDDGGA